MPTMPTGNSIATAAAYGDLQLIKSLLTEEKSLVDANAVNRKSEDGFLPLCIAAFWGYDKIVKTLLQHGADVNKANSGTAHTALHCATLQGHMKVVEVLMDYHPDLFAKDSKGRTPVDFASANDALWPDFAERGCKRTDKRTLIAMEIVRKIEDADQRGRPVEITKEAIAKGIEQGRLAHFSRPGSAYVVDPSVGASHRPGSSARRDRKMSTEKPVLEEVSHGVNRLVLDSDEPKKASKRRPSRGGSQSSLRRGDSISDDLLAFPST